MPFISQGSGGIAEVSFFRGRRYGGNFFFFEISTVLLERILDHTLRFTSAQILRRKPVFPRRVRLIPLNHGDQSGER